MSAKGSLLAASAFLALALGFGWYSVRSRLRAEATAATLAQKQDLLEKSLRTAQERVAARQREAAILAAFLQSAEAAKKARTAAAKPRGRQDADTALLAADPKLRALQLKMFRANLALRFGGMYQKLGLSPAQIAKFEDMATAHEDDRQSMYVAAQAQGVSSTDPDFEALHQQYVSQYYASLATEIEPALSQEVVQMDQARSRTAAVQNVVNDLDSMIPPGSPPLTFSQTEQMTEILANSTPTYQSGGNADRNAIDWTSVSNQATAVLSGPQLQALKAEQQMSAIFDKVKAYYSQQPPAKP